MTSAARKASRRLARGALIGLTVLAAGVVCAALVAAALLLLPPVRSKVLQEAVSRSVGVLPGSLSVSKSSWPAIGALDFEGIVWTDGADTLLSADRVRVSVDLVSMARRDIRLEDVLVEALRADIPAIAARFPRGEEPADRTQKEPRAFPRTGALPGVPSVAVERLRVTAPAVRFGDGTTMRDVVIDAGLDVSRGEAPWVRIDTLAVRSTGGPWRIDELSLYAAPDRGLVRGVGRGEISPGRPVHLSLTPLDRDRFTLSVSLNEAAGEGGAGATLEIALVRDGLGVSSFSFEGRVQTPGARELSNDPGFAAHVEKLPDLDGLGLNLRGKVGLTDPPTVELACGIEKNNWLDGGGFVLRYDDDGLSLEEFALAMPGFSLAGESSMDADSLSASIALRVEDTRWIRAFRPDLEVPEPLSAELEVRAAHGLGGADVSVDLAAQGSVGGFLVDALRVRSGISLDDDAPSRIALTAEAMDHHVGLTAEVTRTPSGITARIMPILVEEIAAAPTPLVFNAKNAGTIRYAAQKKSFSIAGLRVTGDFGDLTADAAQDGEKRGAFKLAYVVRDAPPILARSLGLTEEKRRRLAENWAADAPFSLDIEGKIGSASGPEIEASGTFVFPGPRNVAILLPDSARLGDLGPMRGTFSFSTTPGVERKGFDLTVDLGQTRWIDSSAVHVVGNGAEIVIDTVGVAFEGISVGAHGSIKNGVFDVAASAAVTDSKGIRRLAREAPDVTLRGRAHFRGTREKPALAAHIEGSVASSAYRAPEITCAVDLDTTGLAALMRAPGGVSTPWLRLDRVDANLSSAGGAGALFPLRASLYAAGERLALRQSFRADTTGGVSIEVDTLDLTLEGQDLRARRPFRVRLLSDPGGVSIEGVDLAGTLGTVRLSAVLRPDSSDVAGAVTITLPEEPPPGLTLTGVWPERIDLDVEAKGKHEIAARLGVRGFTLVDQTRPELRAEVSGGADWIDGTLSVTDSSGELVECRARFPASVRAYPPSAAFRDGPISFHAVFQRVPAATRLISPTGAVPPDEIVRIDGSVSVGGTAASPEGAARLNFGFADWPKLSQYGARLEAGFGSREGLDSLETAVPDGARLSPELKAALTSGAERALAARFYVERAGDAVLTARALYPLQLSLHPAGAAIDRNGRVDLRVDSEEIPLADFDPLLPLHVGLGGVLTVKLAGSGPPDDFAVAGTVTARNLRVSVAQQARIVARSDMRLSGTSHRPAVEGEIEVTSGLIRVPDVPQNLHAIEGEAVLWRDSLHATVDDTLAAAETAADRPDGEKSPTFEPQIDVSVSIPSNFWIRGKGLDIELSGSLNVRQKGGKPIVTGELRAARGTYVFLGRTFDLEGGTVTFYGEDELNPSLDIVLTTTVGGNKIQIFFRGTAQEPQLSMTSSEPDMSETDIMSVLLFGRNFGALDDDQADLVKRRSAEIVASIGAAKLQEELGGQLGVDVVTVKGLGREDEGPALAFGKYLSPRTLLSYAHSLDSESRSFVSLEYFLKGRFVLASTYDNQGLGSLGVGWSKDY